MRSLPLVAVAFIVPLALAACDSPGGGGTATVDCSKTPTAPICRGDASSSDGDASTTPGTECSSGARRCASDLPQQCQNGYWVDLAACGSSQVCTNGICEAKNPDQCCVGMVCGTDCGRSCGNCTSGETCVEGQCEASCVPQCAGHTCGSDGCGGTCGACGPNKTCQNGTCVSNQTCSCNGAECGEDNCGNSCGLCGQGETCDNGQCVGGATGSDSCTDIVDCVFADTGCSQYTDDTQFQACADTCYGAGSATGQGEFDAYVGCAQGCGADDLCFATTCNDEQAACFFDATGSGSCFDVLDCFDTCPANDDGTCAYACYEASTAAAQAALLGVNNCLDTECPDATDSTDPCYDTAIAGACAGVVAACQNN